MKILRRDAFIMPTILLLFALTVGSRCQQNPASSPKTKEMRNTLLSHNRLPIDAATVRADEEANDAILRGNALFDTGNFSSAIVAYRDAISYQPADGRAYEKLAEVYIAFGRPQDAVAIYRELFFHLSGRTTRNSQETDSAILMRFALVLCQTNQKREALKVYQQGFHFLPTDRGPLPPLFTTPDFAPGDFEAAAYTAMGIYEIAWADSDAGETDFYQAIATQPSLSTPYFYRGLRLKGKPGRAADAAADFARAEQLGGPSVKPFVDKELKTGPVEFLNAVKKAQPDAAP